jgi:hypothetical protein
MVAQDFGALAEPDRWVLLAYRLPREPSTPRIAVWRKLKRLGVVQLLDGLVALPLDARNREQLEWVADAVAESGGQSAIWLGRPSSRTEERAIAKEMSSAIAAEYQRVIAEALAAHDLEPAAHRRTLGRLRRDLHRIRQRDYFPPPEAERARAAVEGLAAIEEVPT